MAVNFNELKKKLEDGPLTEEELRLISNLETYIDKKILEYFDKSYNCEVRIRATFVEFNYCPLFENMIKPTVGRIRAEKMKKELLNRYDIAGWKIKEDISNSPSGEDYFVFTGKKDK